MLSRRQAKARVEISALVFSAGACRFIARNSRWAADSLDRFIRSGDSFDRRVRSTGPLGKCAIEQPGGVHECTNPEGLFRGGNFP